MRNRRAAPACPHYPGCFGCNFIDLPYPEQLAAKHRRVSEALAAYPAIAGLKLPPVVPSPRRLRYRARVKLVVRQAGKTVLAGLYVPESHRVFDISSCPVHPEAVNRVVSYLKKKLPALGVSPYDPVTDRGQLRYLDFIYSFWRREILLTLVTRQRSFAEGRTLARLLMKRFPFIAGVLQNTNEEAGNVIWGKDFCVLAGRDSIMERIGFLKLKYPAGTFAQVNPAVAAKIYAAISELARLEKRETVLDLYCGVGPIALHLARGAALVWGVDESSLAIAAAKQNARLNGIGNCRFFADDARAKLSEAALALPAIDLVIVNPPRKGLRADIIAPLVALKAPRLIYVSCNPQTLARDLNRLSEHGYGVRFIQPFDMFPQTPEVENVALLSKAPARG
ncbi:MAG TPA: 23S rRNA (uracil(1939)-C(5))-methyltransferase RlmD [Candidatus Acidoferrales bacterium]|nr:23S rRNA (uracil(1939)-C(5))-methyltransferase RlmD [Candidatus Acidoferrales bacterium]